MHADTKRESEDPEAMLDDYPLILGNSAGLMHENPVSGVLIDTAFRSRSPKQSKGGKLRAP